MGLHLTPPRYTMSTFSLTVMFGEVLVGLSDGSSRRKSRGCRRFSRSKSRLLIHISRWLPAASRRTTCYQPPQSQVIISTNVTWNEKPAASTEQHNRTHNYTPCRRLVHPKDWLGLDQLGPRQSSPHSPTTHGAGPMRAYRGSLKFSMSPQFCFCRCHWSARAGAVLAPLNAPHRRDARGRAGHTDSGKQTSAF